MDKDKPKVKPNYTVTMVVKDYGQGKIDMSSTVDPATDGVMDADDMTPALALAHFGMLYMRQMIAEENKEAKKKDKKIILLNEV